MDPKYSLGRLTLILVAMTAVALSAGDASAQSTGCTAAIVGLMPCLGYFSGNATAPSASCCSQLAGVVQSLPQCLCAVLDGSAASQFGLSLNSTQALALPGACGVKTPPASDCKKVEGPATAPVAPASKSPPSTAAAPPPVTSTPEAGTGSKATPRVSSTSEGVSAETPFLLVFFLSFLGSYASTTATGFWI